jgi:hypothetical protein
MPSQNKILGLPKYFLRHVFYFGGKLHQVHLPFAGSGQHRFHQQYCRWHTNQGRLGYRYAKKTGGKRIIALPKILWGKIEYRWAETGTFHHPPPPAVGVFFGGAPKIWVG